jgi:uncharacterized protein DUF4136
MKRLAILGIALVTFALPVFGQPKYGVTVLAQDKGTDFSKLKTYAWQSGWDAPTKVHQVIVASVDRELKALGFEKKAAGPSDVVIKYAALRRTDMNISTKATGAPASGSVEVGSLQILMTNGSGTDLWKVRLDQVIDTDPAKMTETIDGVVKAVFAKYPTRVGK